MRLFALLVAAVAFAAGMLLPSSTASADARVADVGGASVLLAPFRPLLVQLEWSAVDDALRERRTSDALGSLRTLERMDPDNVRAAVFRAHIMAYTLAPRAATAADRAGLTLEALDILARVAKRSREPDALREAGLILMEPGASERGFVTRFFQVRRQTPLEAAALALDEAAARAPGVAGTRSLQRDAWRLRALELVATGAPWTEAQAAAGRAASLVGNPADAGAGATLEDRMCVAWRGVVDAAAAPGATGAEEAFAAWRAALAAFPADAAAAAFEAAVTRAVLPALLQRAEEQAARGDAGASLLLLEGVLSIAARLPQAGSGVLDPARVSRLVGRLRDADPAVAERARRLLPPSSRPSTR